MNVVDKPTGRAGSHAVRGEVAPGDNVERAAAGLGRHVHRMLREVDPLDPDEEIDPASLGGGAGTDHPDT